MAILSKMIQSVLDVLLTDKERFVLKRLFITFILFTSFMYAEMVRNNNTNIVEDKSTGLMWLDDSKVVDFQSNATSWRGAIWQCDNLPPSRNGGYDDWRLPNYNELLSIMDFNRPAGEPLINKAFVNVATRSKEGFVRFYWTSTTYAPNNNHAWVIYFFNYDNKEFTSQKTLNGLFRCVRGEPK